MWVGDVTERSWKFWEAGDRKIPDDVETRIYELAAWRETALNAANAAIADGLASAPPGIEIAPPVLVWYRTIDDWTTLTNRDGMFWRPHCSVIAALCAKHRAIAVPFHGPAYVKWLADRKDSELMRAAWAASIFDAQN